MSYNLSAFAGAGAQFFSNNGLPLSGGLLYTYTAGTSTPALTYTSSTGLIANTNPIVLDATGRVVNEIWFPSGTAFKFVLQDASFNQIGTWDNIPGVNNFASSQNLSANGYALLPNGMMLQWGNGSSTGTGARTVNITLPTSFPTAGVACNVTDNTNECNSFGGKLTNNNTLAVYVPAASVGASTTPAATGNVSFTWMAIGY